MLEHAVGELVEVEDFSGKEQSFKVVSYSGDILKLEVQEGKYVGAKIQLDLGTNSTIEAKIKRITLGNTTLFHERLLKEENREDAQKMKAPLDVASIILAHRDEYRKQVARFLSLGESKLPNSRESNASTIRLMEEIKKVYVEDGIISDDF